MSEEALQQEVVVLRRRNEKLVAVLRLVVVLLKGVWRHNANCRLADGTKKLRLLRAAVSSAPAFSTGC